MRILIKIGQQTIFALLLVGCAHNVVPSEPSQDETISPETLDPHRWHDGSNGGEYGIGEGWKIEILPAEYETILESFMTNPPAGGIELIVIPAEYEWVKDDNEDLTGEPVMVEKLVTIPIEYEWVEQTLVTKPAGIEYYLTEATYNTDGSLSTPRLVKPESIPAKTQRKDMRVVKTPERKTWQTVPLERRLGYRLVLKTPARTEEDTSLFFGPYYQPRIAVAQPWRFLIRKPNDGIVHVFDNYEDLTAFVDSLV